MAQTTPGKPPNQGRRRGQGFVHISEILAEIDFLADLERETLAEAERHGPIRGRIRPAQRPWSRMLDVLEHERQQVVT